MKSRRIIGLDSEMEVLYNLMIPGDVQIDVHVTQSKTNNISAFQHSFVHTSVNKIYTMHIQVLWHFKSRDFSHEILTKMS